MKLTWSGVTFSPAITRSPSASSPSSITIRTIWAARMRLKISSRDLDDLTITMPDLRDSDPAKIPNPHNLETQYYHRLRKLTSASDSGPPRPSTPPGCNIGLHQQVAAKPPHVQIVERDRVAHALKAESLDRRRPRSDHDRRDEEGYPVD